MSTLYPDMIVPAYFHLNGTPVRVLDPAGLPEKLTRGQWEPMDDPIAFRHDCERISQDEFERMVSQTTSRK